MSSTDKQIVTFKEASNESMVGKLYWSNHDDTVWFCHKWTRATGIFLINLDTLKIKDVSERAIDRGYNTIHDFMNGKAHAQGKFFTPEEYTEIKFKLEKIKAQFLSNQIAL